MKSCPTCGCEIADASTVCETCEAWAAALVEPRPAGDQAVSDAPAPPMPVSAPAPAAAKTGAVSRRNLTIAAGAVGAVALTGFVMSARGGSPPAAPVTAATVPAARVTPPSATASKPAAVTGVQTWTKEPWGLDYRRRGVAFELLSENTIKTWFGPARPSLVVRCTEKSIEAFVVTGSPLKIDPRVEGKAVTISVDGEPSRTEHWTDSDRHTEVFAPDAAAFTGRLRTARTLQFGYSPHNSSDVVAQFHVAGIDALLASASKVCGVKGSGS